MVGRLYVKRQAASLLKFARATSNPELAAVLVQKAADLKAQAEPQPRTEDKSPVAPVWKVRCGSWAFVHVAPPSNDVYA